MLTDFLSQSWAIHVDVTRTRSQGNRTQCVHRELLWHRLRERMLSFILAAVIACASCGLALADTTRVEGFCTDSSRRTLSDVLLQIFRVESNTSAPAKPGLQLGAEEGPTAGNRGVTPIALFTSDPNGFWSLSLNPGTYLFTAQTLLNGGAVKLSTQRIVTIASNSNASVPLQLETEFRLGQPPPLRDTRRVFFVTDRGGQSEISGVGQVPPSVVFSNQRGKGFTFGTCDVEASGDQRTICTVSDRKSTLATFRSDIGQLPTHRGLIYLHGFNVGYKEAMRTGGLLAKATQSSVFVYDWTSAQSAIPSDYDSDEENLIWSLNNGMALLVDIVTDESHASLSLFAHSMGSRAVVELLSFIKTAQDVGLKLQPHIKLIDLAASDLDLLTFQNIVPLFEVFSITTNTYASDNDNALKAASLLHANHFRVGETAVSSGGMQNVISVDATPADPLSLIDPIGHGYFQHPDLLEDIGQFFAGVPPSKRTHLLPATSGSFWWFKQVSGVPPTVRFYDTNIAPDAISVAVGATLQLANENNYDEYFYFMEDSKNRVVLPKGKTMTHTYSKAGTYRIQEFNGGNNATVIVRP